MSTPVHPRPRAARRKRAARVRSEQGLAAAAATVLLAALAAGCGGSGDDPPRAPAGWRVTETRWFAFAHPEGWTVTRRPARDEEAGEVVELVGPVPERGVAAELVAGATPAAGVTFVEAGRVNDADRRLRLPGARVARRSAVAIPGATEARLVESELAVPVAGRRLRLSILDVLAMSDAGTAVNLVAVLPASDAERAQVHEIVGSLRVR